MSRNTKAQVWVETVIYTLIALAIITAVLAFVRPKINELQDKLLIDSTVEALTDLDDQIVNVWQSSPGNTRIPEFTIKKGSLTIQADSDCVFFFLKDSNYQYSEPGQLVKVGNIDVRTVRKGQKPGTWGASFILNYSKMNMTYEGKDIRKDIYPSPTPYKISFSNQGQPNVQGGSNRTVVDVRIVS